jgi:MFS family permease
MAVESRPVARTFPRPQWGAVIAGVILAIAVHIVLGLVGATLGFAAAPADSAGVGAAAAIWALMTPFVATLLGGWLACRIAAAEDRRSANVHAILVWCIGLVAGALFLAGTMAAGTMSAGAAAGGAFGSAQRVMRAEAGAEQAGATPQARADEAAKMAAAGAGAAAIAAIAGLLGAVVAAGVATRRGGRGLGWRIALQRREERPAQIGAQERYASTQPPYGAAPRVPGTPGGAPEPGGPPTDPYHH